MQRMLTHIEKGVSMKKLFTSIIVLISTCILTACEPDTQPSNYKTTSALGNFTIIEENNTPGNTYIIIKHDETGVLYLISNYNLNTATMTPILKTDGTPYTVEDLRSDKYYN